MEHERKMELINNVKSLLKKPAIKRRLKKLLGCRVNIFEDVLVKTVSESVCLQNSNAKDIVIAAITAAALGLNIKTGENYLLPSITIKGHKPSMLSSN